jgi:hypothetical protein
MRKNPIASADPGHMLLRNAPNSGGGLASVLHIHKSYCELELGAVPGPSTLRVEFELYKKVRKTSFSVASGAVLNAGRVRCQAARCHRSRRSHCLATNGEWMSAGWWRKSNTF